MKYLSLMFLIFSFQSYAQITGNPHVKDSSAIKLNSSAVNSLMGKWKLVKTVELLHGEEQSRDRGIIVAFGREGTVSSSWCIDCYQENAGKWEVLNEQTIKFSDGQTKESRYLAGDYVVYKLTDDEMLLVKVLTSSGDWKKFQYFSRNLGNPPISELSRYCINCTGNGSWCFGDRPDKAKEYWAMVHDLLKKDGEQHHQDTKILEGYDWLLQNAPCIDKYLYVNAVKYYKSLLKVEKDEQTIKSYREKIKRAKEQQQLYFNE